ncbi:zinc-dependent metalloprotease [Tessaracoccus sp. HDW20]|nr:zinc-dependent metalloprotease [Tessaracoccus coleopterorum]
MMKQSASLIYRDRLKRELASVAGDILTGTENGFNLLGTSDVLLLPSNVAQFTRDLDVAGSDVVLYLLLREGARQRLFHSVGWLSPSSAPCSRTTRGRSPSTSNRSPTSSSRRTSSRCPSRTSSQSANRCGAPSSSPRAPRLSWRSSNGWRCSSPSSRAGSTTWSRRRPPRGCPRTQARGDREPSTGRLHAGHRRVRGAHRPRPGAPPGA